jgi:hypothetical protein
MRAWNPSIRDYSRDGLGIISLSRGLGKGYNFALRYKSLQDENSEIEI